MRNRPFFRSLHTDRLEPRLMLSSVPPHAQASDAAELATSRAATAHYHRVEEAIADGYQLVNPCGDPDPGNPGTVGMVFINFDLLDGELDPSKPEALFYEQQENGRLRLVGVEHAVVQDAWHAIHGEEAAPPSMFGQEFHESPNGALYGIHWWWMNNPNGQFAIEHPDVSC